MEVAEWQRCLLLGLDLLSRLLRWLDVGNGLDGRSCVRVKLLRQYLVAKMSDLATPVLVLGRNGHIVDRRLELDQRVGLVVRRGRQGFTRGAKVKVVANNTLVTHALDVGLMGLVLAQGAVAEDAVMSNCDGGTRERQRLVDGSKTVARMGVASIRDAVVAVIEVWARKALVADSMNVLIAAITDGIVADVTAGRKKSLLGKRELGGGNGRYKVVSGVVSVLVLEVAATAQVKVIALGASDKVVVGKTNDAVVASA